MYGYPKTQMFYEPVRAIPRGIGRILCSFIIVLLMTGCVATKVIQARKVGTFEEIVVDDAHLQMEDPVAGKQKYELMNGHSFFLHVGDYKLPERKEFAAPEFAHAKKVIQVIADKDHIYTVPLSKGEDDYKFNPEGGFHAGQTLIIGIGYGVETDKKFQFYPQWVGLVEVK